MPKEFIPGSMDRFLSEVSDPRVKRRQQHILSDILVLTILAVISGADDWVSIHEFGMAKIDWLRTFLDLKNGIPSHDTLGRVFAVLCPQEFSRCFTQWITSLGEMLEGGVIAIDGKTVRGSFDKSLGKGAIHMVSAWSSANGIVLGQYKVDDKSNEITAIPKLLDLIDIKGAIVTIDAMGTQKKIAETYGVAFFDLFTQLGGEGTIIQWADGKPALANKDYTHPNSRGCKKISDVIFDYLMKGKELLADSLSASNTPTPL